MPLILSGNVASATAAVGYDVANSCVFDKASSDYMLRTAGTPSDADKHTFSCWVKRGQSAANQIMIACEPDASNREWLFFPPDDTLKYMHNVAGAGSANLITTAVFRDRSAWYNVVLAFDSGQSTAANRTKLYVNGTRITSFGTEGYVAQNANGQLNASGSIVGIGTNQAYSPHPVEGFFDGNIAEVCFVDGQVLTPTSFGEFDSDTPTIWKPIDVSGLTFGDNGFYLDFEDSDNLGDDESGNTNDFTETNLAATNQSTDTPTNNFCTLNSMEDQTASNVGNVFSEGNLKITDGSSYYLIAQGTIAVTAGKWYWETFIDATASHTASGTGVADLDGYTREDGAANGAFGWMYCPDGDKRNAGTSASYGDTYAANDVIGIALDMDNLAIYFSKNGTWQASGDPESGASKTNAAYTNLTGTIAAHVYDGSSTQAHEFSLNFGNPPYANTSDAADANGYGAFEYAPPSGYLSLCKKNLGSDGG